MTYEELLASAPEDQSSEEFLQFLRDNNPVVREYKNWLVIKNFKYDRPDRPWHTAFHTSGELAFRHLIEPYWNWEWLKKGKDNQTVLGRFHIHFYRG